MQIEFLSHCWCLDYTTKRECPMPPPFSTRICAGMRSLSASTWLMMPIILPLALSESSAVSAISRVSPMVTISGSVCSR